MGLSTSTLSVIVALAALGTGSLSVYGQQTLFEVEPNNAPSQATEVTPFFPGDWLVGICTGSAIAPSGANSDVTADFHKLYLQPAQPSAATIAQGTLPITMAEIVLTQSLASQMFFTIRGYTQNAGIIYPSLDLTIQSSLVRADGARVLRAYFTGTLPTPVMVRITGRTTTTAPYTISYTTTPVVPVRIDGLLPGVVTITTETGDQSTDTDLWLFGADGRAIPGAGNDDTAPVGSPRSTLTRTLAAGRYYLAICDLNLAVSQPSPADDANRNRGCISGDNLAVSGSSTANVSMNFNVASGPAGARITATKTDALAVMWYELMVGVTAPAIPLACNPSDVNLDGSSDGNDFVAFINSFALGDTAVDPVADLNRDGVIDGSDFVAFINAFALGC